jgi:hypothetical protein
MKKNFEKFITISLAVVSAIFVVFLLVIIFNTDIAADADNSVVHALFFVFTAFFLILSSVNIYSAFANTEKVNQILLFKTRNTSKKASVGVVRKLAKQAVSAIQGIKVGHIHLFVDDNNDVTLKATAKIIADKNSEPVKATVLLERATAAIQIEFLEILGLEFKEIELKLVSAKYNNPVDMDKINALAQDSVAELEMENGVTSEESVPADEHHDAKKSKKKAKKEEITEVEVAIETEEYTSEEVATQENPENKDE